MWLDDVDSSDLFKQDSSFKVRWGLAGVGVSFESINFPFHFIRHAHSECFIDRNDGSELFLKDATFFARSGLASSWVDDDHISLESYNIYGAYLRHYGSRLRIDTPEEYNVGLFKLDATWKVYKH